MPFGKRGRLTQRKGQFRKLHRVEKVDIEEKASGIVNSQSDATNLKIADEVSEDSKDDNGGHSGQTSNTATVKGDNSCYKENTIQDHVGYERVKVKQEPAGSEVEDAKEAVSTEDHIKKVKKECNEGKEEEDDEVISIKGVVTQVQKPEQPDTLTLCIVCAKVRKCKYNIVGNGDVKGLCNDVCFKLLHSSPITYLKEAKSTAQAQSKFDNQSNDKPVSGPAKNSAPNKSVQNHLALFQQSEVYKTCTLCQLMNVCTSKPFLTWQDLNFCGEDCLGKYQAGLSYNCSYCSGAISCNNKAKFCCRVGNEVKQFCSTNCNNDYVKGIKLCEFCNKDLAPVGETFKDFCCENCLQKFVEKNTEDVEIVGVQKRQKAPKVSQGICVVCKKVGPVKCEFELDSKMNQLCSDVCISAFQYANKLNTCDNCGTNLNSENQAPQYIIQFEGQQRRFCSFICVNTFRNSNNKIVPCAWCAKKKSNFDMMENVEANNENQWFCSVNCLSHYKVNLQAASNQVPQQISLLNHTVVGKSTTPIYQQLSTTTRSDRMVTKDKMDLDKSFELEGHDNYRENLRCDACSYTTPFKYNLSRHIKKVHDRQKDERTYTCEFCGKELRSKYALKLHVETVHTKVYKFTCPTCKKGYNQLRSYKGHLASHNDFLREKCDLCPATFNHKTSLVEHKKTVHDNITFKCPEPSCSVVYSSRRPLYDHIKAEHKDERLSCDKCSKTFKWRSSLGYHKKTVH